MWFYFVGSFFVFLDFPYTLPSGGSLNFIPDFIGYAFFILASFLLGHENGHFKRLRFFSFLAFALSFAEFFLNLFAVPMNTAIELIFSVLMTLGALYITYEFAEGAKALERSMYKKMDADKISSAWIILAICSLLSFFTVYFPAMALPFLFLHWLAFAWFASSTFHFLRKLSGKEK